MRCRAGVLALAIVASWPFVSSADSTAYCSVGCFYVQPNGGTYGSENGADWTNAYDGFTDIAWASVACGSTIWVAGGTYTQDLLPNKDCSASSELSIRRARADTTTVTGAAGYSAGFDSQVLHTGSVGFESGYNRIRISGRTLEAGETYSSLSQTGCGWKGDLSGGTAGGNYINVNAAASNNVVEYMELEGDGEVTHASDGRAVDETPSSTSSDNTYRHLYVHDWESAFYFVNCDSPTIEYVDVSNIAPANTETFHPNGIITWGCANGIVRYSFFHKGTNTNIDIGEGVFWEQAGGSEDWQVYGNIWWDITNTRKAIEITADVGAIKIYNNTFHSISNGTIVTTDAPGCTGGEYRNNLAFSASHGTCPNLTSSNNVTCDSAAACWVDATLLDYHILSSIGANLPRDAGINIGAPWNVDRDGITRGADGTWDVGAYEYDAGGAPASYTPRRLPVLR